MGKKILYGDGIHDDLPAIQEMLDCGARCVVLPEPENFYLISGTIFIHSYQELKLGRYTLIKLAEHSSCAMIENAEPETWNSHISIVGGIWDMNHKYQSPNPWHFPSPKTGRTSYQEMDRMGYDRAKRLMPAVYTGMCMRFNSIKTFSIRDITIVNPVVYGMQLSYVEDFTVENVNFEYNEGSPKLWNMDGVHVEGGCKNGLIRNLKGACHDDMVAITSDDLIYGPIENIVVDGVYAYGSHSAVRLLSVRTPVRNVHVTNIFGSYYVYCIAISKYYEAEERSCFENITIDHVYASLCEGTVDVKGNYEPLLAIGSHMDIKALHISDLYRDESHCAMPTIGVGDDTSIQFMEIAHAKQTNDTGMAMPFLRNQGSIHSLQMDYVDAGSDLLVENTGKIENSNCKCEV